MKPLILLERALLVFGAIKYRTSQNNITYNREQKQTDTDPPTVFFWKKELLSSDWLDWVVKWERLGKERELKWKYYYYENYG